MAWRFVFVAGAEARAEGRTSGVGGLFTLVVAVAVLLPGVLSFGDETVGAVGERVVPAVAGAVTTIVMFGAAPGARLPPVRLHVTVPDAVQQFQFGPGRADERRAGGQRVDDLDRGRVVRTGVRDADRVGERAALCDRDRASRSS